MARNFQCGRTCYSRDGLLEGSQYLNVRRPDAHGGQNTQCHSSDAEQGAKWPLERMSADQRDIEHEWYGHLRPSRMLKKSARALKRTPGSPSAAGATRKP